MTKIRSKSYYKVITELQYSPYSTLYGYVEDLSEYLKLTHNNSDECSVQFLVESQSMTITTSLLAFYIPVGKRSFTDFAKSTVHRECDQY